DGFTEDRVFLLTLDPNQRDQYYNQRLAAKLEADKAEADRKAEEERQAAEARENEKLNNRVQIMLELGFKRGEGAYVLQAIDGNVIVTPDQVKDYEEAEFFKFADKWRSLAGAFKAAELKAAE